MTTRLALPSLCAAAALLGSAAGRAQSLGDIALNQLEPPPAGDAFISVPSPSIGGHVAPRASVLVDYADRPLNLAVGNTSPALLSAVSISDLPRPAPVVGTQVFLHINASFDLWDRLLLAALLPVAVHQSGESPSFDSIA